MSKLKKDSKSTMKTNKSEKKSDKKSFNFSDMKNIASVGGKSKSLKQKDMNFLDRYEIIVENKPPKIDPKLFIMPSVFVVSFLLALVIVLNIVLVISKNSNKKIEEYINSEDNIAKYSQSVKLTEEIGKRTKAKNEIEGILNKVNSYPNLNAKFIDTLFGTAGQKKVSINNIKYMSEQGSIIISCKTSDENNVAKFVVALKETKLFEQVTYKGYSGSQESEYSFSVTCICKGNK